MAAQSESALAPYVRYGVENGVATITLDSPHNRNAISTKLMTELRQGLSDAAEDDAVRTIVLTHTGNTFCAGADLSEASNADPASAARRTTEDRSEERARTGGRTGPQDTAADGRTRSMISLLRGLLELPKPVVASIDGNVRAGGMGIVAACDIVVAGRGSSFALTEVRIGLAPFMISLTLLPRLNSRAASRYYLTGERFDAATAAEIGLVTAAAEDPRAEVERICAELRKGSPQGLAESKRLVNAGMITGFDRSADELADRSASFFGTDEVREGMTAFLQRRPPSWAL